MTMIEKMIRPVRCHFCKKAMYYYEDPRHTPEAYVVVETDVTKDTFYAHVRCWNERIGEK